MRPKNDARAFPFESQTCAAKELGLTKREWFAGMALQGLVCAVMPMPNKVGWESKTYVEQSFMLADNMMDKIEKDKRREDCDSAVGRPAECLE